MFNKKTKSIKKITSILLVFVLLLGLLPTTAFAGGPMVSPYTMSLEVSGGTLEENGYKITQGSQHMTVARDTDIIRIVDEQMDISVDSLSAKIERFEVSDNTGIRGTIYPSDLSSKQYVEVAGTTLYFSINPYGAIHRLTMGITPRPKYDLSNLTMNSDMVIKIIFKAGTTSGHSLDLDNNMQNGTAFALDKKDGTNRWQLAAKPDDGYMLDYWEYSTDGGGTYPEENRIINDDQNTKANITVTLTEDRVYRASFKPAHILLLDKPITIQQYHWAPPASGIPFERDKIKCEGSGSPQEPESELIREGLDALLQFYVSGPSHIPRGTITGTVELYKNQDTDNPFWTIELGPGNSDFFNVQNRCFMALIVEDIPYMDSITVKVNITYKDSAITTTSTRHYEFPEGAGIERDDAVQKRFDALDNLKEYYKTNFSEKILEGTNTQTHHNLTEPVADGDGAYTTYDSFSAVRYLLRYAYEDYFHEIRWIAATEEDVQKTYDDAIARFEEYATLNEQILAGNGEAYKNVDGIKKVLFYHNVGTSNIPSFAYVPSDSIVRDAVEAGMENYNPRNWTINGGSFITSMSTQSGDGYVKPGGYSSQIVFSLNHAYADGIATQTVSDRDVLIFGNTITANQYPTMADLPSKDELVWALGILAEKYDVSDLRKNSAFTNALNLALHWGVSADGTIGIPLYPVNVASAQKAVDDALEALTTAYPNDDLAITSLPGHVFNVIKLIRAIGDVDPTKGDAIAAARSAYDALEEAEKEQITNYAALTDAEAAYDQLKSISSDIDVKLAAVLGSIYNNVTDPTVASIGGEWAVLSLARSESISPEGEWAKKYLSNLNAVLADGGLDGITTVKYTEFSRIALALSAMGIDASAYSANGKTYDVISKTIDYNNVIKQGINGPIFALLALDSKPYDVGNTAIRNQYIDYILGKTLPGGGWSLTDAPADTDVTAMTLQALAPYYGTNAKVKAAVDEALTLLKSNQDKTTGGFYSMGQYNSESTAQVIVALTSLGIDPASWAVSSTHTPITALLQFYSADTDGFKHVLNAGTDGMATEQAAYALVAYSRYLKGRNTLYDMSDAGVTDEEFDRQKADSVIALIDDITEPITLLSEGAIHKAKAAYKLLKPSQKDLVTNYSKLEKAAAKLSELKVAESQRLISAIGKVSLDSEKAIETAKAYYAGLTQDEQAKVSNYPVLVAAERALVSLKNQQKSDDSKKPGNSASGGSSKSGGSTKTVTVEIDDVEYVVSEKTKVALDSIDGLLNPEDAENALPSDFANLTEEQINKIVDIYKQYAALTDDEKLFVDNYAEFEEVLNKLGEELHYDNSTGVDVRGNDSLKWHIELMVKPNTASDEQLAKMRKTLGEDAGLLTMYDISFVDILTGEKHHSTDLVKVKIPVEGTGFEAYDTIVVIHFKDDGTYEYLDGVIEDGNIIFTTSSSSFSQYGVAGFMGDWKDIIADESEGVKPVAAKYTWLWISLIVVGILGFSTVLVMKRKQNSQVKENK